MYRYEQMISLIGYNKVIKKVDPRKSVHVIWHEDARHPEVTVAKCCFHRDAAIQLYTSSSRTYSSHHNSH